MGEEIDLDAVESNEGEAPDYRPLISEPSTQVVRDPEYRMKYISALEAEESSRYEEFARVAEDQGFRKVAEVFKNIMQEERDHGMNNSDTMTNLRLSIQWETDKINKLSVMLREAENEHNDSLAEKLKGMIKEEESHVTKLQDVLSELERQRPAKKEQVCSMGVCAPKVVEDD